MAIPGTLTRSLTSDTDETFNPRAPTTNTDEITDLPLTRSLTSDTDDTCNTDEITDLGH